MKKDKEKLEQVIVNSLISQNDILFNILVSKLNLVEQNEVNK